MKVATVQTIGSTVRGPVLSETDTHVTVSVVDMLGSKGLVIPSAAMGRPIIVRKGEPYEPMVITDEDVVPDSYTKAYALISDRIANGVGDQWDISLQSIYENA